MSNPKSILRNPNHEYIEETNKRKLCDVLSTIDEESYFRLMDTTNIINLPLHHETSLLHISMQINKIMKKNSVERKRWDKKFLDSEPICWNQETLH